MQTLAHTLAGYRYSPAGDADGCPQGLRAIRLTDGARAAQAFWATDQPDRGALFVGADAVTLVTQYGQRRHATAPGGVLRGITFHRAVTYVLDGTDQPLPPPAPTGLARIPDFELLADAGSSDPALQALGADVLGTPLTWQGLCGVHAYRVYEAPVEGHGRLGPWRPVAEVRSPAWPGPAVSRPTAFAVQAIAPTGRASPLSAPLVVSPTAG